MILNFVIVGRRFECSARNGGRRERSVFRGPHLVRGSDPPQPVPPPLCCLAEEIWLVLRVYPYQHRYRLYASWKKDSMERFHTQIVLNVARFFKVSFLLQSSRSTEYEGGRAEVNQTNHAAGVKGKCEAYRDDSGQTEPRVIQLIN